MSETVHYKGIATKIYQSSGQTTSQKAEEILKNRNKEIASYYNNPLECLCNEYDEEFFYHSKTDSLYKLTCENIDESDDIIRAKEISKDSYEYELRFYNGGAGFRECLEEAFDKL
jgi:hypothetical protein